jgi:hypothetical protein
MPVPGSFSRIDVKARALAEIPQAFGVVGDLIAAWRRIRRDED